MNPAPSSENKPVYIETERLLISPLKVSDAQSIFEARTNPEVNAFLPWKPKNVEEVEAHIRKASLIAPNTPESWYLLGTRLKESGELVGDVGIHFMGPQNQQAEIGYMILEAYQGKGYATESIVGVLHFLFYSYKKHRVTAAVDPKNKRSVELLKRIGMRQEAHHIKSFQMDGEWLDDVIFAILREEWEQKGPTPPPHEKA